MSYYLISKCDQHSFVSANFTTSYLGIRRAISRHVLWWLVNKWTRRNSPSTSCISQRHRYHTAMQIQSISCSWQFCIQTTSQTPAFHFPCAVTLKALSHAGIHPKYSIWWVYKKSEDKIYATVTTCAWICSLRRIPFFPTQPILKMLENAHPPLSLSFP